MSPELRLLRQIRNLLAFIAICAAFAITALIVPPFLQWFREHGAAICVLAGMAGILVVSAWLFYLAARRQMEREAAALREQHEHP